MRVCLAPRYRSPYEQPIGWLSPCGRLLKKSLGETFGAATVAGYVGPGFHTWPPGHIPQNTDPKPLPRIRASATAQRSFGDTFGAATGVSDPRLQQIRIRNHHAGGNAATVAGYVGPGFHNWPPGHIPQDNGSESASPHPRVGHGPKIVRRYVRRYVRRDVRRRDRGQRPQLQKIRI